MFRSRPVPDTAGRTRLPNRRTNGWQQAARWRPTRPPTISDGRSSWKHSSVVDSLDPSRRCAGIAAKRVPSGAWGLHIHFGPEAKMRSPTRIVDIENNSLPLAEHAEDRTLQRIGGETELVERGVADERPVTRYRVVALDHALHNGRRRSCGLSRPCRSCRS